MDRQKNNIQVFRTTAELSKTAAGFIMDLANKAISKRGRFVISLSGGHTPEQLYKILSKSPFRTAFPWKDTFVFWGDERCVPLDDKDNNAHMARALLLDHINIPPGNIFPIPVDLLPALAAKAYEYTIKEFFGAEAPVFDLVLLGLGENGHTASLFPFTPVIKVRTKLVKEVYVEEQKMYRITMTTLTINNARNILFLVAGEEKAEILKTVLTTEPQPEEYPAQLIAPVNGSLYWFVDKKAASLLPGF